MKINPITTQLLNQNIHILLLDLKSLLLSWILFINLIKENILNLLNSAVLIEYKLINMNSNMEVSEPKLVNPNDI